MIRNNIISFYIILFWLPFHSLAAVYEPILEQIKPGTITIIGETHKKAESIVLFESLVSDVIRRYQCVIVGLEIASDQQAALDTVMQGKRSANEIALWPVVDHPAYRHMIESFAVLNQKGSCIKVIAIDSGMDNKVDRDLWMALSLAEQAEDVPILVLLGSLHTLKRVNWNIRSGWPSVAEILFARGFDVNSFPQRWLPENCLSKRLRVSSFVSVNSPQALTILNDSLMSLINAKPHKSVRGVVDGFVVWECDNRSHS